MTVDYPTVSPLVVAAVKARVLPVPRVATLLPSPAPERLVLVERAGGEGERELVLDDVAYAVSCWEADDLRAERLALDTRAALRGWAETDLQVYNFRSTSPAWFPDPATRRARFVFRCSFTVRGA